MRVDEDSPKEELGIGTILAVTAFVVVASVLCCSHLRSCNAQEPGSAVGIMTDQMVKFGCTEQSPCEVIDFRGGNYTGGMSVYRCTDYPVGVYGDYIESVNPYVLYSDGDGEFASAENMRHIPPPGVADPEMVTLIKGILDCYASHDAGNLSSRSCSRSNCNTWVNGDGAIIVKHNIE